MTVAHRIARQRTALNPNGGVRRPADSARRLKVDLAELERVDALTAATGPFDFVEPQPRSFPRGRLLDSFRRVVGNGRWENGFCYEPYKCEGAGTRDPCEGEEKELFPNADLVCVSPFVVYGEDTCGMFEGPRVRDVRARRALAHCESEQVAFELWTGTVMTENPSFDQAGAVILTPDLGLPPAEALACLEQALAECSCGAAGMIHATPQIVTYWNETGQLVFDEVGILRTVLGTIVVADSGYPGTPPAGAADLTGVSWAFATDMLTVYMSSDVDIRGGVREMDRANNRLTTLAERTFAVAWDQCCHAAAGVMVTPCGPLESAS